MKFYVKRQEIAKSLRDAGQETGIEDKGPFYNLNPNGEKKITPDGEWIAIDVRVNEDGTWGSGNIMPPISAIEA